MRIIDFETHKVLRDVALYVTADEASALIDYLTRLVSNPEVGKIHLSDLERGLIERELTVALKTA